MREMSLLCQLLGHRRSRSRATFDDKRQQWVSDCRRCATILLRESDGKWIPAPPAPDKLMPLDRKTEVQPRSSIEPQGDLHEEPSSRAEREVTTA
jgi:hypothetical protein